MANAEEDERCLRCGRRMAPASWTPTRDGAALALALTPHLADHSARPRATQAVRQPALFAPADRPRVVPIFGPNGSGPALVSSAPLGKADRRKSRSRPANGRPPREDTQQCLAFVSAEPVNRAATPAADSEIYCNAPVAHTQHRLLAGAIDWGIILSAFGVLVALFAAASGPDSFSPAIWAALGGLGLMSAIVYQLLWALSNGDSPGLHLAGLELVDFDGRRPRRRDRLGRMLAFWLSLLPGAIGLLWALVDEETLTWHDHISKTFPTPRSHRPRMPLRP